MSSSRTSIGLFSVALITVIIGIGFSAWVSYNIASSSSRFSTISFVSVVSGIIAVILSAIGMYAVIKYPAQNNNHALEIGRAHV